MIRNNLATRPFYNESAVRTWVAVLAVLAVALTVLNVQRLIHYSRSDTELATKASRDEQRAAELLADAARLRASVDRAQIEAASLEAREANELIDRRTFSWTDLFNRFESTLPDEVRITSMRHDLDRERGNVLTMAVLAREVDQVNQFMKNLEATRAFSDLLALEEQVDTKTGQLQVLLQGVYRASPAAAAKPAPGAALATPPQKEATP
jgi:Tfp pilus assembly protein PilN